MAGSIQSALISRRTMRRPRWTVIMDDTAERAQAVRETCPFLTAKQAAFHLGLAYSTLKRLRQTGTGPKCRLHGRTWRYHIDDIEAWSAARARGGDRG
ncbi:helix-turn-helix transcriptional regulator [Sphingomonas sp. NFR15]|uniref:helix-turn-helix transcriptional regulator n=1 Tax=Sphingomonas sp. NFR15 TaxID=1566282 RepID=UPI003524E135